eukprot:TRINITY_DN626_c0_g1_i2.p2 TRINITY_DN626_c0_g1~~TRINITY_DN626_c0_g1_i2.p2  ORF type:complete len:168 (-),score=57.87 TRINITY_DN626_c0_g1_i2:752-1255(-)
MEKAWDEQKPKEADFEEMENVWRESNKTSDEWYDKYFSDNGWENEFKNMQSNFDLVYKNSPKYHFKNQNPFMDHPSPKEEGLKLFQQGQLDDAILAIEAHVQKNGEDAEAWHYLGLTNAENNDDNQAVAAFNKAREIDPNNSDTLLALATSLINNFQQDQALKMLKT